MLFRGHVVVFFLVGLVANRQASAMQIFVKTGTVGCTKFVECEDGYQVGTDSSITCQQACLAASNATDASSSNCCVEPNDCDGFTGNVCADEGQLSCATNGTSTGTDGACFNATISNVVNSCAGPSSCFGAGNGGFVGPVANSCVGNRTCIRLAIDEGIIDSLENSCNSGHGGQSACSDMAAYGGAVGSVADSCNGDKACQDLAREGGNVGAVVFSCNADQACSAVQCKDAAFCEPDSNATGIYFMNGSCNIESGCENYMGDSDESGLTCTANATAPVTFSPIGTSCITESVEFSSCSGSNDLCIPLVGGPGPAPTPPVADCTDFVECDDGFQVVDGRKTSTSCHDACFNVTGSGERNCCTNADSCVGFTGKVCADDGQKSCIGRRACNNAKILSVVNSCQEWSSCSEAGRFGAVGPMINSCQSYFACLTLAYDGAVGSLTNSCNLGYACKSVADWNGVVGSMTDSCNGVRTCEYMAYHGGTVGSVTDSCNAEYTCSEIAHKGAIGSLAYSCNVKEACEYVQCQASYTLSKYSACEPDPNAREIDFMNGSCNSFEGCRQYMGKADGSGLTCTANAAAPVTFSPNNTTCFDTDSEEVSTCDGTSDVCTSLCPAGDAYIPSNYWLPPLDKPDMTCENVRLKISDHGDFSCIPIGEGICRDNGGAFGEWRFGIEEVDTPPCEVTSKCRIGTEIDSFPVLIDPANTRYPITGTTFTNSETGKVCKNDLGEAIRGCNYAGTTHVCISENIESDPNRYSNERPYMFFYDEKSHQYLYQLVCDGIGEEGKLPELKMVNNEDLADSTYVDYPVDIVKFKKGATPNKDDANELWKMYVDWNGFEDPETRRIGKLASFIGVAHPKLCREYVSATDKPCWREDCNDGSVETPEDYERVDCELENSEDAAGGFTSGLGVIYISF